MFIEPVLETHHAKFSEGERGKTPEIPRLVYRAVGEPPLFSDLVPEDAPECLVEQAVNAHLSATLKDAEASLPTRFGAVTLGMLSRDFEAKAARLRKPR